MYDSYYFFSFVLIFSGGGVDYLSTIKRDGSNKNGENTFSPKSTVPAYAKFTLKPVPSGMKKDGVPVSTTAPTTPNVIIPLTKPKEKGSEPLTVASAVAALNPPKVTSSGQEGTYSYETLRDSPPDGIDLTIKESYLTAPAFLTVFAMDSKSFDSLPKWKKDLIKKRVGLF